ncbi:MAG: hypothetical protein H6699_01915 [Myxococcales bacterium]|nr:hypothetical protein [Myxococcales bacterium]
MPLARARARGRWDREDQALVEEAFGDLRVGRLDRDTSSGRGLTRILDAFRRGDTDCSWARRW